MQNTNRHLSPLFILFCAPSLVFSVTIFISSAKEFIFKHFIDIRQIPKIEEEDEEEAIIAEFMINLNIHHSGLNATKQLYEKN